MNKDVRNVITTQELQSYIPDFSVTRITGCLKQIQNLITELGKHEQGDF